MYYLEKLKRKNSRRYTPVKELGEDEKSVVKYMEDNDLQFAGSPYIFTHIKLSDGSIITQKFNGITCSPEKLRELLTTV